MAIARSAQNVLGTVGSIADRIVRVSEALTGEVKPSPVPAPTPAPAKSGLAAMAAGTYFGIPGKWWLIGVPLSILFFILNRKGGSN